MKTIDKLRKFAEGGKVRKLLEGDLITYEEDEELSRKDQRILNYGTFLAKDKAYDEAASKFKNISRSDYESFDAYKEAKRASKTAMVEARNNRSAAAKADGVTGARIKANAQAFNESMQADAEGWGGEDMTNTGNNFSDSISNFTKGNWKAGATQMAVAGAQAMDAALMGDKNFGAQSQAIDDAVHGVSGALMKSGNPYAMAAAAALEGANFLTKAGGQTVQGFDVDINSSGYGDMGHKASSSSRDFAAAIGLGGIFNQGKMQAKLAKRNKEAQMAMNAANIANEQSFEQEARANSIQNTITNNQIALAGGLDTSLLGG